MHTHNNVAAVQTRGRGNRGSTGAEAGPAGGEYGTREGREHVGRERVDAGAQIHLAGSIASCCGTWWRGVLGAAGERRQHAAA